MTELKRILFLLSFIISLNSYGQEWLNNYNQSLEFYNADQLDEARKSGESALILYKREAELDHANYRVILRQLSVTCYGLSDLDAATDYANQEVESWRGASKVDESSYIDALDNLGIMYSSSGNYNDAISVFGEAFKLAGASGVKTALEKAIVQGHLAEALFGAQKLEESNEQFTACIKILEQEEELPGEYLNFCYSYGALSTELANYPTAVKYLTNLFQWYDETEQDPLIINANFSLGSAYTGLNDYTNGEKYYSLALVAMKSDSVYYQKEIIELKQKLANNLQQQGKSDEASALLAEISTNVIADGAPSEDLALFLNSQATSFLNNGKITDAIAGYEQAMAMLEGLGLQSSDTYTTVGLNAIVANNRAGNLIKASTLSAEILSNTTNDKIGYYLVAAEYGSVLRQQGNFKEAALEFDTILNTDRSSWPPIQKAQILNKTASFYQFQGNFKESGALYMEALAIEGVESDKALYQSLLFNYVTLLQAQGRLEEAEILLNDLKSSIGSDNPEIILGILRNIGSLAQAKGDYTNAASRYNEALAIAKQIDGGEGPQFADILLRLATLDKDLGNYQDAEPKFIEVSQIIASTQGSQHPNYASVANNMGILYQQMGNYTKAEAKFKEAVEIYKSVFGEANPEYVLSLENLATLYELIGEEEKALEIMASTLEANKIIYGERNPNYAVSLHNYASLLQKTDRKDEAYEMLVKVLELQEASIGRLQPSYANSLHNLAILAQEQENYILADSLINEVLVIRGTLFDINHPSYTSSLFSKAVLLQVTNKYDEAWETYNQVIEQYLGQINKYFPSLSESEKNAFYAKVTPVVNRYKEFCIEYYLNKNNDPEVLKRLYDVQLATKALLLNAVNKTRERILQSGDQQLIADFNLWTSLKKQLVNYYSYSKEQIAAEGINIASLEDQANTLEKSLSKASLIFASEFDQSDANWQMVASSLRDDEAAVELLRIERNSGVDSVTYVALVLHQEADSPMLATLPYGGQMEGKYFNYYKNTVKYRIRDQRSFNIFWNPIDELLNGSKTIYISADGVYNKININTIFNVDTDNYLIQDYFVKYISSTKDLVAEPIPSSPDKSILCIGNPAYDLEGDPDLPVILSETQRSHLNMNQISPLPGTEMEIEFIDSLLRANNWKVDTYLEKDALESQLKGNLRPKVIHLATHGFFMPDLKISDIENQSGRNEYDKNPLFRSGLLFAGASNIHEGVENDGVLTAYEAMNLYLDNTELVVLSACETALGDVKNGEGVYGLQRALVVAGVQKLIMSLWKVNDEATMQLMQLFYANWSSGKDIYQSLQEAQIAMMNEHDEPYYWGAFIMIGR